MGNSLYVIKKLLYDKKYIDREEFQSYCSKYSSGGIIPTNISVGQLISENDTMIKSLLNILLEKDILSNKDHSNMKTNNSGPIEVDRIKVLENRQRIDALFDYLKSQNLITHKDMINSFEKVSRL
jgi:hypothetical protein